MLAPGFRWQRILDEGVCGTIEELAKRERVNRGYVSRLLRLTLLAPDIVEAVLDGRQPEALRREDLLGGHSGGVGRAEARLRIHAEAYSSAIFLICPLAGTGTHSSWFRWDDRIRKAGAVTLHWPVSKLA